MMYCSDHNCISVDQHLYQCTGYIDVDKINPDAWPALIADFAGGEQGITALAFGNPFNL